MSAAQSRRPPLARSELPVCERLVYLNHAGVSPLPRAAAAALDDYAAAMLHEGSLAGGRHDERLEEVRRSGAALMGVPGDDVAFVKNTTEGLAFVASGLEWRPGDRVVVPACEFPSNLYPWRALERLGVEVVTVAPEGPGEAVTVDALDAALAAGGVRLVAVSWVQFGRGHRIDVPALAERCRAHGALLCLDAIQGLGVLPADLEAWGVDFATADAHKWLLGPEGAGLLYVRAERRDLLRVLEPGWASVRHRGDYENRALVLDDSARRFEGGSMNVAGLLAMGASLDLLAAAGIAAVWEHVDRLCDRLAGQLARRGAEVLTDRTRATASGIVTFGVPGRAPEEVAERLGRAGFVVAARGGGVRVAPHGYNTVEEIDALVEAVARSASGPP